jgi:hypothetical protein
LKAIGDTIDEDEFVMTSLNGLTRPWDAFIQSVCGRKEKLQFESLWEECIQGETRVANREALLARDDDQDLATHTKGGRKKPYFKRESHRELKPSNKFKNQESHSRNFQKKGQHKGRDLSSIQCYHCDKMGHKANNCPSQKRRVQEEAQKET